MSIEIARIYDADVPEGYRVLVDRLWPRGVSKERASLNLWAKDVAPSAELRAWFGHKSERFAEFSERYRKELNGNPAVPVFIDDLKVHPKVVLLYAAKDSHVNHAQVLAAYLRHRLG